ncbi:asparagine synthase (glutamine-hydrolyzing) [Paludibacterium purpuratum]|uniref:asparagine synthase (glutamine-hydrolyzing) n=1 Tax=Paludibacterium purpuratum TaxID=1144873 RepID=A0A4R7B1B6_9NEIS|nr:asparagine synthase (glutamine-hydrolyzing) [Paludibacterium purpuratum]TDR76718.1 asparagine synthase (glutamine-hydrolysing) [Paludibacterium purpuratum]
MCGILGGIVRQAPIAVERVESALGTIAHRGPDAQGIYIEPPVYFGHRRLSIIDLDARANQPMTIGNLTICFNGEIYNFREIRKELEAQGVIFQTSSDTEVVIRLFRAKGLACLARLEGMFAFAIWDAEKSQLFITRDRFGEKPVYIYHDEREIAFASEIPAIERLVGKDRLTLDEDAIKLFFQLTFIPAPRSPYKNLHQVRPGSWIQFNAKTWDRTEGVYYEPRQSTSNHSFTEATEELRTLLSRSVSQRMLAADVPVATFLSGGIDSSVISGLATTVGAGAVRAYSIGFPQDPAFDESSYARLVAQRFPNLEHIVIDTTERALLDFTDTTLGKLGEPYADASLIPTAFLCSHVEEKVVLGGDAADELFAGYGVYAAMRASQRLPTWLKRLLLMFPTPSNPHAVHNPLLRAAALFRSHMAVSAHDEYLSWRSYATDTDIANLGFTSRLTSQALLGEKQFETLADLLIADLGFNLHNDMLKKVDFASMQHGKEVRLPYLDTELVEFALSLPEVYLIKGSERKRILRAAFRDFLPETIFTRRKQGFLMPIRQWFANGLLAEKLREMARESTHLDFKVIDNYLNQHQAAIHDHSVLLWCCYAYLKWQNR